MGAGARSNWYYQQLQYKTRDRDRAIKHVLHHFVGGMGFAAVQICKILGAKVMPALTKIRKGSGLVRFPALEEKNANFDQHVFAISLAFTVFVMLSILAIESGNSNWRH